MNLKRKTVLLFFLALLFLLFSGSVFADTEIDWPTSPLTGISPGSGTEFHEFIAYLYGWGIGLGGLATFIMLVLGGIEYMTSEGKPEKMQKAVGRMKNAALGLTLLLSSWLILHTINPALTTLQPLPDLWDEDMYEEDELAYEKEENPCEFAIFYTDTDYGESQSKRIYPGDLRGDHLIRGLGGTEYLSVRGFRKMNEIEEQIGVEELKERGRVFHEGYIDGGPCGINLYEEKRRWYTPWWWPDECGKLIGTANAPNRNFDHAVFDGDASDIQCFMVEDMLEKESTTPE